MALTLSPIPAVPGMAALEANMQAVLEAIQIPSQLRRTFIATTHQCHSAAFGTVPSWRSGSSTKTTARPALAVLAKRTSISGLVEMVAGQGNHTTT